MANSIAYFYPSKIYEKPLNPILGETYEFKNNNFEYLAE
jgi:hypothetical protein